MKTTKTILALLILSTVLITSCVSKKKYTTAVDTANKYQALNEQLTQALSADQSMINDDEIQIQSLQDELKVTLVNSVIFSEGGYTLNSAGKNTLASIAPTLSKIQGQQIVVQGFTDNVPIGPHLKAKFPTNLELSTARANVVTEYLISKGVPPNIISSQGFGEQHPVAANDNAADKAKNRRVEIIIKDAQLK